MMMMMMMMMTPLFLAVTLTLSLWVRKRDLQGNGQWWIPIICCQAQGGAGPDPLLSLMLQPLALLLLQDNPGFHRLQSAWAQQARASNAVIKSRLQDKKARGFDLIQFIEIHTYSSLQYKIEPSLGCRVWLWLPTLSRRRTNVQHIVRGKPNTVSLPPTKWFRQELSFTALKPDLLTGP